MKTLIPIPGYVRRYYLYAVLVILKFLRIHSGQHQESNTSVKNSLLLGKLSSIVN